MSILIKFPPKFSIPEAHHVTLAYGISRDYSLPDLNQIKVVGYSSDCSLEALVVEIDGKTKREKNNPKMKEGLYHITLSRELKRRPLEANDLVLKKYTKIEPFTLNVIPKII